MFFATGLFGSESEEIGVPYIDQGKVQSAVLDPDGKHFYTLNRETITKWQLESMKRASSFKVELSGNNRKFRSSISSDSNKMIIWNRAEIVLIDLPKHYPISRKRTTNFSSCI